MAGGSTSQRLARALARAARLVCPRCGRAPLFRSRFRMNTVCAACDLTFERAQGLAIFLLWFFPYSRSVWLAVESVFNPEP